MRFKMKLSDKNMAQAIKAICKLTFALVISATNVQAAKADIVKIGGTGAAMGTMKELGQAFVELHRTHRVVVVPSLGSGGGIKALQSGALQLAVSGRDLNLDEKASGLTAVRYGTSPFVFVTYKDVPTLALTKAMIADLYSGKQQNWSNGRPVRLVMRPKKEGDTILVQKISPAIDSAVKTALERPGMVVAITDTDSADQVEKFPNSFGTSTLALLLSERRQLTVLPLEGVSPSVPAMENGSYPYAKEMYAILPRNPSPATRQFMDFVQSAAGRDILRRLGHKTYFPK